MFKLIKRETQPDNGKYDCNLHNFVGMLESAAYFNIDPWVKAHYQIATPEEIADAQEDFRKTLLVMAKKIGKHRVGDELFSAIKNGAAVRDDTYKYRQLAQELFKEHLINLYDVSNET